MSRAAQLLLWLGIVAWLVIDLFVQEGPIARLTDRFQQQVNGEIVALVNEAKITRDELSSSMRDTLWRRGEEWSALDATTQNTLREKVLAGLVDQRLLAQATVTFDRSTVQRAASDEERNFTRMLQFDETRLAQCFASQAMTAAQFRAAVEQRLVEQRGLSAGDTERTDLWAKAQSLFAQQPELLQIPVRYHAAHVFLSAHEQDKPDRTAEVQRLADQLATHGFSELASMHSDDERTKRRGGDLGWFTEARMPADFMQAVKALTPGQVSKPVRTTLGWHVIQLLERKPAETASPESLREEATTMFANQDEAQRVERQLSALRASARIVRDEVALASCGPALIR